MYKKVIVVILALAFVLSTTTIATAAELKERLKGYILLQVEARGEAWYVNPNDGYRYYMKDGTAAYQMMREFGLGITNVNLSKIPIGLNENLISVHNPDEDRDGLGNKIEQSIGTDHRNIDSDGDGFTDGQEISNGYNPLGSGKIVFDIAMIDKLKGKILIQVEGKGEAWYVNPVDGKRYYMANGEMAYQVMRYLSLGITNDNLEQIPVSFNWKAYENKEYGFSIQYPSDWIIDDSALPLVYITNNVNDPGSPAILAEASYKRTFEEAYEAIKNDINSGDSSIKHGNLEVVYIDKEKTIAYYYEPTEIASPGFVYEIPSKGLQFMILGTWEDKRLDKDNLREEILSRIKLN